MAGWESPQFYPHGNETTSGIGVSITWIDPYTVHGPNNASSATSLFQSPYLLTDIACFLQHGRTREQGVNRIVSTFSSISMHFPNIPW